MTTTDSDRVTTPRGWRPGFVTRACPKCGDESGFRDSKPRYRHNSFDLTASFSDWLEWQCVTCGYTVETATADRSAAA